MADAAQPTADPQLPPEIRPDRRCAAPDRSIRCDAGNPGDAAARSLGPRSGDPDRRPRRSLGPVALESWLTFRDQSHLDRLRSVLSADRLPPPIFCRGAGARALHRWRAPDRCICRDGSPRDPGLGMHGSGNPGRRGCQGTDGSLHSHIRRRADLWGGRLDRAGAPAGRPASRGILRRAGLPVTLRGHTGPDLPDFGVLYDVDIPSLNADEDVFTPGVDGSSHWTALPGCLFVTGSRCWANVIYLCQLTLDPMGPKPGIGTGRGGSCRIGRCFTGCRK